MDAQPELVGLIEIAQHAGVRRNVVTTWRSRYDDFPSAVAELSIGPVFSWEAIRDWLEETGRQTDAGWSREQVRPSRPFPVHGAGR